MAVILLCILLSIPAWPCIHSVTIRGTKRPLHLDTRPGQTLDSAPITKDVRRLWATGWFDDVQVQAEEIPDGTAVVFNVVESPRTYLRKVRFEPEEWKRPVVIQPGAVIDRVRAERMAATLKEQLAGEGYPHPTVVAELAPVGYGQADLQLRVEPGPHYRVNEVRFTGNLGLEPRELEHALRSIRVKWLRHPPYSERILESDMTRLQSLYLSRGYPDARVALRGVDLEDKKATVTVSVDSGLKYPVRTDELCRCLLDARRESEKKGELNFSVTLQVKPAGLIATVENEPVYTVGRIEFRGHHSFPDLTLRRALLLQEGQLFDRDLLRQSLVRLNRLGFFEPLTEADVRVEPSERERRAELTISLKERPRGRWTLSGPAIPSSAAGSFEAAIASRLPGLSGYYAAFRWSAYTPPVLKSLPWIPKTRMPIITLEKPYLPGQGWQSGFRWGPQLGWREMVGGYGASQLHQGARMALQADRAAAPGLMVPVDGQAGMPILLCESQRSKWRWVRGAATLAVDWMLTVPLL